MTRNRFLKLLASAQFCLANNAHQLNGVQTGDISPLAGHQTDEVVDITTRMKELADRLYVVLAELRQSEVKPS